MNIITFVNITYLRIVLRQLYSSLSQWQRLGTMVLPWIAPSPTTSYCINRTKLYEESLTLCHQRNGSAFILLHLGRRHYSTSSQLSYSCSTRWPVGNESILYRGARHLLPSVKHVLLHTGQHVVQDVPFTNKEDDDTGQAYLCPRTSAPVSPIFKRPSTL